MVAYVELQDTHVPPNDFGYAIAVDGSSNVYVTGSQNNGAGNTIAFLAKYDATGVIQWQRSLTDTYTTPNDEGFGIAVDGSGNVYVTGWQHDSAGHTAAFVAKYSATGAIQWQRILTETSSIPGTASYAVALDSSANVYLTGWQNNSAGNTIVLVVKYDTTGALQWQRSLADPFTTGAGPAPNDFGYAIAVDGSSNVYVTGSQRNLSTYHVVFVAKYDATGAIQWQRILTDTSAVPDAGGLGIAVDGSGNVYLAGSLTGDNNAVHIAFVAKYDATGAIQWQRTLTDTYSTPDDYAVAVAVDGSGNIYVAGQQYDSAGNLVGFVVKYDATGAIQWQRTLTDTYSTPSSYCNAVTVDASGNLHVTGVQSNSAGNSIAFILTVPTDGTGTGTYSACSGQLVYAAGTLTDAAGALTDAAGTLTDAAGALIDAADTLTDAAGTLTSCSYAVTAQMVMLV